MKENRVRLVRFEPACMHVSSFKHYTICTVTSKYKDGTIFYELLKFLNNVIFKFYVSMFGCHISVHMQLSHELGLITV